jgi:uroporphyrinogen decarboxylase
LTRSRPSGTQWRQPLIGFFRAAPERWLSVTWSRQRSDDYRLVKTMLYQRPDLMHRMLAINADSVPPT